eukprot:m.265746 g.265746  ORF g.265746 m.265746 type:complete len:143 (+) comp15627_c0_seq31:5026-5454(+)
MIVTGITHKYLRLRTHWSVNVYNFQQYATFIEAEPATVPTSILIVFVGIMFFLTFAIEFAIARFGFVLSFLLFLFFFLYFIYAFHCIAFQSTPFPYTLSSNVLCYTFLSLFFQPICMPESMKCFHPCPPAQSHVFHRLLCHF